MNLFRTVGAATLALGHAARRSLDLSIWGVLLIAFCIRGLVLLLLVNFHDPRVGGFGAKVVERLGGEQATHYPNLLYALPELFRSVDQWVVVVVGSVALGAAVGRFAKSYGARLPRRSFAGHLASAGKLMLLGLVGLEMIALVERLFDLIPLDFKLSSIVIRLGLSGIELLVLVLVQCLLAYTTAWVVLRGASAWAALRDSIRMTAKTPVTTFLLVLLPAGVLFPFTFALYEMDLSERDLPPEIMAILLGARLLLALVLTFLLHGALTRIFLWRVEEWK